VQSLTEDEAEHLGLLAQHMRFLVTSLALVDPIRSDPRVREFVERRLASVKFQDDKQAEQWLLANVIPPGPEAPPDYIQHDELQGWRISTAFFEMFVLMQELAERHSLPPAIVMDAILMQNVAVTPWFHAHLEDQPIPCLRRMEISVDPAITPQQLATLYRRELKKLDCLPRPSPLSLRYSCLALFASIWHVPIRQSFELWKSVGFDDKFRSKALAYRKSDKQGSTTYDSFRRDMARAMNRVKSWTTPVRTQSKPDAS